MKKILALTLTGTLLLCGEPEGKRRPLLSYPAEFKISMNKMGILSVAEVKHPIEGLLLSLIDGSRNLEYWKDQNLHLLNDAKDRYSPEIQKASKFSWKQLREIYQYGLPYEDSELNEQFEKEFFFHGRMERHLLPQS